MPFKQGMNKVQQPYTDYKHRKQTVLTKRSCLSQSKNKEENIISLPAFFELVEFEICQQLQASGQQQLSPLLASNLSRKQRIMKINLSSLSERQHGRVISMSDLQSGSPRFDSLWQSPGFVSWWSTRIHILRHVHKQPTGCLLLVEVFDLSMLYLDCLFPIIIIWVECL